jgi:hypothetical protein
VYAHFGDQVNENKIGRACGTYGEELYIGYWWGSQKERGHLKDLSADGRIILNGSSRNRIGRVEWFDLAEDMGKWQALVNTVMENGAL